MTPDTRQEQIVICTLSFVLGVVLTLVFDYRSEENSFDKHKHDDVVTPSAITFADHASFEGFSAWLQGWVKQSRPLDNFGFSLNDLLAVADYDQEIFDGESLLNFQQLGISEDEEAQLVNAFKDAKSMVDSNIELQSELIYDPSGEAKLTVKESISEEIGKAISDAFTAQFPKTSFEFLPILALPAIDEKLLRFGEFERRTIVSQDSELYKVRESLVDRKTGKETLLNEASVHPDRLSSRIKREIGKRGL